MVKEILTYKVTLNQRTEASENTWSKNDAGRKKRQKLSLVYFWHVQGTSDYNWSQVNKRQTSKVPRTATGPGHAGPGGRREAWALKCLSKATETARGVLGASAPDFL